MRRPADTPIRPVFTEGSVLRHLAVVTVTSGAGLMAVFLIDILSMFYVSLAHRDAWCAAVNLVSKVLFFPFALNMGMMVGIGTVVSIAIGRREHAEARRFATLGLVFTGALGLVVSLAALPFRAAILDLFGAQGEALEAASRLLAMTLPVNVLLSVGMGCASILRACGDPGRAMLVTLAGGLITAICDPLFIFGLNQGVDGVGEAIVISRLIFVTVGLWGVVRVHGLVARPRLPRTVADVAPIAAIALPAMATNLAMPFADWFVTRTIWQFGVSASAAAGVYDRLMPFAFSLVFALTTAVGPIAGQNLGARRYDRVRLVYVQSLLIASLYGVGIWLVIAATAPGLAGMFGLTGPTGDFFLLLCRYATLAWIFVVLLLVANSMLNTLGRAQLATAFNWGRATIGTMPFVWFGARAGGAEYAILGIAAAAMVFAVAALLTAGRLVGRLENRMPQRRAEPVFDVT